MHGGNWANKVSDTADAIGTAASVAGLASGATGIGAPALPILEGIAVYGYIVSVVSVITSRTADSLAAF